MSQSRGTALFAPLADLSFRELMDVPGLDSVSWVDPIKGTWKQTKIGGDRDEGYYGFGEVGERRKREQVLETDNGARLQRNVSEVADRYISITGKGINSNGKTARN